MARDDLRLRLVVLDTGPLITLAAADGLDYLLYPGLPVQLPDAVLYEATVKSEALGAESIARWAQSRPDAVRVVPTQAYADFLTLRSINPGHRERHLGERAAIEAIRYGAILVEDERALLLTEDDRMRRGSVIVLPEDRERMIVVTTWDFLIGLEQAGRINSADAVYRRAEGAGRSASRQSALAAQHEKAQEAVRALLRRP